MRVTLQQIADRVGVSRPLVSMVLNGSKGSMRISDSRREEIESAARELGYIPNLTAQVLSGKASRAIAIFNANVTQYSLSVLTAQFLRNAAKFNYQLLIDTSFRRTDEEYCRDVGNMLRRSPDGAIILGQLPPQALALIQIPTVVFQQYDLFGCRNGDFYPDLAAGGYMAGLHLLSHGHRKAVYVCTRIHSQTHDKLTGLRQAWREAGLPDEDVIAIEAMQLSEPVEGHLLSLIREKGCSCGLMSNDFVAARALPFLRRNGIRVPEDFALIGYDGNAFAYLTDPPLSTISQSYDILSSAALELLLERIEKKESGCDIPRLHRFVKPVFFQGGSCGCPCEPPPVLGWSRDMLFLEERFSDRIVTYEDFIAQHKPIKKKNGETTINRSHSKNNQRGEAP